MGSLPELHQKVESPFKRWLPLGVLVVLGLAIYASGLHSYLTLESIANNKAKFQSFVNQKQLIALGIYIAAYIAITALSIPGALIMTLLGGILFPFWIASFAVILAATLGATVLFIIARSSLGAALREKGGETLTRMSDGLQKDAASYLLFLRLVPVFPFAAVNLAAAIFGVPLKTYIWTTAIGILPGSFAFVFAATNFGVIVDQQKASFDACKLSNQKICTYAIDYSALVGPNLLMAFAALGCVALIPVVVSRFSNKTNKTKPISK
jgi:uncharacterized membrane protein YdjX (TVP38/TMEM64 family)